MSGCAYCGKNGGMNQNVGQAARAQTRARMGGDAIPGFDIDTAYVVGEENGDEPRRLRMNRTVDSVLTASSGRWATGSGVQELLDSGAATDITKRAQRGRLFSVGGQPYTSRQEAERVSRALNKPMIELA